VPWLTRFPDRRTTLDRFQAEIQRAGFVEESRCSQVRRLRKLLESGVDLAVLAEPPISGRCHIEACIDAGCMVFAEKPMAVDAPGVRRLLRQAKRRAEKLSIVSGFETRYSPSRRAA